jgi:hypothetical protein
VITEKLADHTEIDKDDLYYSDMPELGDGPSDDDYFYPQSDSDDDFDADDYSDEGYEDNDLEDSDIPGNCPSSPAQDVPPPTRQGPTQLPCPGPLEGYEYSRFEPKDEARKLAGHIDSAPMQHDALTALKDLSAHIHPKQKKGAGYVTFFGYVSLFFHLYIIIPRGLSSSVTFIATPLHWWSYQYPFL